MLAKINNSLFNFVRQQEIFYSLLGPASITFALKFANLGISFLFSVALTNILGVSEYGSYVYVMGWVALMVLAAVFGCNQLSLRLLPAYRADGREDLLLGFRRFSHTLVFTISVLVSLGLLAIVSVVSWTDVGLRDTFFWGATAIPMIALATLLQAELQAAHRVASSIAPWETLRPIAVTLIILLATRLDPTTATASTVYQSIILTALPCLIFYYWQANRAWRPEAIEARPKIEARYWALTALPLVGISGTNVVLGQCDILMLGWLVSTEASGLYNVASRLANLADFAFVCLNFVVVPYISKLYSEQKMVELQQLMRPVSLLLFVGTLGIIAVLVLFRIPILSLFGPSFLASEMMMIVLLTSNVFGVVFGFAGFLLIIAGHERLAFQAALIGMLINIVLNFVFILWLGPIGAAIATALATVIKNGLMYLMALKRIGIDAGILCFFSARNRSHPS